jgi:hypothetical protein
MRTLDVLAACRSRPPGRGVLGGGGRMAAKFVLKQGSTGKYQFNLVASNGR